MKKRADVRSKIFLGILILLLSLLLIGIVLATYAFPNGPTKLRSQSCSAQTNTLVIDAFGTACSATTNIDLNDGTTQTSTANGNNQYIGVRTSNYNTSITNCGGISNVKLCYEWWSSSSNIASCVVNVDANGGISYTTASTTCPRTSANPGEICTDVTSLESWTCSNFFTSSGTRAYAYVQAITTTGGAKTLTVDDLYFNVTYIPDATPPVIDIIYPLNTTYTSKPSSLNLSISDTNLQACWWSNNSGVTNMSFNCSLNISLGNNVSLGSNKLTIYANDSYGNQNSSSVTFKVNPSPNATNISISPNPAGLSSLLTINASEVSDSNNDSLTFYCSEISSSPTDNNLCSGGGNLTGITSPYKLSCLYYHSRQAGNYTVYCRLYDGNSYSSTFNSTYTVIGNTLSTSVISVAGDTSPSYIDTVNNGKTDILISGSVGMSCKWSSSDLAYSSMTSSCSVNGSGVANCSINDVSSEGFYTRYIACQDSYGNSQDATNNLNVDFYLDYTAPTTYDDSDVQLNVPPYSVTIYEEDNVDSDPKTYYCSSSLVGCTPSISIDNNGLIIYDTTTRGANYLRYYSYDFAGNNQTIVNKTINMNKLPIFSSASDNAATIKGGTTVTISSVDYDNDAGQTIKLYVCNSSGATAAGCLYGTHCSATGLANLSCGFASEEDSSTHTWYAYVYDALNESATVNNPLTGTYITDVSGPVIIIISPLNGTSTTQSSISINVILSEPGSGVWYSLDGNTTNVSVSNTSLYEYAGIISGLTLGEHNISFWANDSFGNLGNSSVNYFSRINTVDVTSPIISISNPSNASYNSPNLNINISADESLNWAGYKLNSGSLTSLSNNSKTSWYASVSLSDESIYNLTVYANDTSNNQATKNITFYTDSMPPRYSSVNASPSVQNVSGAVNCSIYWTDGFNIASVIIGENSSGSFENHSISFSGSSGSASYNIIGSRLTNPGNYQCNFYATDVAGNFNSSSATFNVQDLTSPIITIISPVNSTYLNTSIFVSVISSKNASLIKYSIDGGANVTMINTSKTEWSATTSALTDQSIHRIIFSANDIYGNIGNSSTVYFTVDTTLYDTSLPIILITNLSNGSYYTTSTPLFNASSNKNLRIAEYSVNNGNLTSMSNNSMVSWYAGLSSLGAENMNTLVVFGNDTTTNNNRGNSSLTFYVDTLAPRFLNASASPSVANETQNIVCNVYVNDTFALNSVKIAENSSGSFVNHTIDIYSAGYSNYTITNAAKGNYTCIFYAKDNAGNVNSTSVNYIVNDVTAPIITINSPQNVSYNTNSILLSLTLNENASSAYYSLNNGVSNISLDGNNIIWSKTIILSDGSYNVEFFVTDNSGNLGIKDVNFTIDTTVYDVTPPSFIIWSPVNNTYYITGNTVFNITSDESLVYAGYKLDNGNLTLLDNTSSINWNKTLTLLEGQHNITFFGNDSSANRNYGNKSAVFYIDLTNPSIDSFICVDSNDSADVLCSATVSDNVTLNYYIFRNNATGIWLNSSAVSISGQSNSLIYTIPAANTSVGSFGAQLDLYDNSGRSNSSSTIVNIFDDVAPKIINITYSPNTTDLLDPGVTVNVNTSVLENYQIGNVYLMYKKSGESSFNYVLMSNLSAENLNYPILYTGSFVPGNGTYYIKVNASDSGGNQNISINYTLNVENDTALTNSTSVPFIKSYTFLQRSENNSLGYIYLNNSGENPLTLNIKIDSLISSAFNINYTVNNSVNYTLLPGENLSILLLINSTGLSGLYDYNISLISAAGSFVYERNFNIQPSEAPYIVTAITKYSSPVTTGQTNIELVASVTNYGTLDASNVYLTWIIPSDFTLVSGNLTRYLGSIPIGSSSTNTITVSVDSNATDSVVDISASANATGGLNSSDSKQISINSATLTNSVATATGGGGGGGSSEKSSEIINSSKIIEVVRGKETKFNVDVYNKYSGFNLKNLSLEITGFLPKYISITPNIISDITYNNTKSFAINIKAPSYKDYEEYDLRAVIKGILASGNVSLAYSETQNIKLIIQEISYEDALKRFKEANISVEKMKKSNFKTEEIVKLLKSSENLLNNKRYMNSYNVSSQILDISQNAFNANDLIRRIFTAMQDPRKSNLIVGNLIRNIGSYDKNLSLGQLLTLKPLFASSSVSDILNLGIAAFERGDYISALSRAEEARNLLVLERKGNFFLFLYLYWHYILLAMFILMTTSLVSYNKYKKNSVSRNILDLNKKEESIRQLTADNQKKYFTGKISASDYHRLMNQYQNELAKIRKTRNILRNERIKLLNPVEISHDLDKERDEVENEIKKLQEGFYKDKKITENEYKTQFESSNERLAEIEEEGATLKLLGKNKKSEISKEKKKGIFGKFKEYLNDLKIKRQQKVKQKISNLSNRKKEPIKIVKFDEIVRRKKNLDVKNKIVPENKKGLFSGFLNAVNKIGENKRIREEKLNKEKINKMLNKNDEK